MMYVYHKAAFTFEERFSTFTYDARRMCFNFTHILMIIVGTIDLHNSLQTFSIRVEWRRKQFRAFWSYTPHKVEQMQCICKRDIKMKTNAVQNKNTIPGVYCSSRSFEHIFPAILKTVYSEKRNSNKELTVSINHIMAMHSPKLFSPLSLIQSNLYYQKKRKKMHSRNFVRCNNV